MELTMTLTEIVEGQPPIIENARIVSVSKKMTAIDLYNAQHVLYMLQLMHGELKQEIEKIGIV